MNNIIITPTLFQFDAPDHDIVNIWKGMEDAKALNLTRSIGVSNFAIDDINRILNETDTVPAVNEIEVIFFLHFVISDLLILNFIFCITGDQNKYKKKRNLKIFFL